MNKLNISPEAQSDLLEMKKYISEELGNHIAAQNIIRNIIKSIKSLSDFAHIGKPLTVIINFDTDYRYIVSGHYLIFYHCDKQEVYIVRVLYGRRDYIKILFGNIEET